MSWRDSTAQHVQDELDDLLDSALGLARHLLQKNGEFSPFGVTLDERAETSLFEADPAESERPPWHAVLDMLYEGLAQERHGLRAAAVVADVTVDGADAVRVALEHREGGPDASVFLPYSQKRLRKSVEFGELFARPGERRIWPLPG